MAEREPKAKPVKSGPISRLRELVGQIIVFMQFDLAVVEVLDDQESRLYRLEEDNKLLKQSNQSLNKRYSELLYALSELKRDKN